MRKAVIAGCTGLIGAQLLDLLLAHPTYHSVVTISRRPLSIRHEKLEERVMDLEGLDALDPVASGADVFCCLGTTIKQAGSESAFRKVDFDYPLALARVTHQQGARSFHLVTAMGSDKNSSIFYNRVKGEAEEAIRLIGFSSLHIYQPSLLLGHRTVKRSGEGAAELVMRALDFVIPKKYKAIDSAKVAKAMVAGALGTDTGLRVHSSGEMQAY
jgi:uncharacterized protein YbjT (DUF2867 family)